MPYRLSGNRGISPRRLSPCHYVPPSAAYPLHLAMNVLIRRCAWHRMYRGYPFIYGVASWRGEGFDFTDGLCHECAVRARAEMGLSEPERRVAGPRRVLALVAALTFLLAPEVLDQFPPGAFHVPSVLRPAALVPKTLAVREVWADEPLLSAARDVAAVLALVTAAASAVEGPVPVAQRVPLARPAHRPPERVAPPVVVPPTRAQLRACDEPASPIAAY